MRAGVWFKAMPRIDRVLFDLTIQVARYSVRSASLVKSLLCVTRKLEALLESKFTRAIKEIGYSLACKLSLLAKKWGNRDSEEWARDTAFARYLAIMKINRNFLNT